MKQRLIRCICFFILLIACLSVISKVLMRKVVDGPWNTTIKVNGFYNEDKNAFTFMGFGSSHAYCSINPEYLDDKKNGISSYVFSTQQQPTGFTYYYIKEAAERQKLNTVILETYMLTLEYPKYSSGVYHDAVDFLPSSMNKIEMIFKLIPLKDQSEYYFPIIKYHTRWSALHRSDFTTDYLRGKDTTKGYVKLNQHKPIALDMNHGAINEEGPIDPTNLYYLNQIVSLSKKYHFKLLLYSSPYVFDVKEYSVLNTLKKYARDNDLMFLNCNDKYREIGLNPQTDFYDTGHTNESGAKKVSTYLKSFLINHR